MESLTPDSRHSGAAWATVRRASARRFRALQDAGEAHELLRGELLGALGQVWLERGGVEAQGQGGGLQRRAERAQGVAERLAPVAEAGLHHRAEHLLGAG